MNNQLFVSSHSVLKESDLPPHITHLTEDILKDRSLDEEPFIVSNIPTDHAYILAPEINWYLDRSHTNAQKSKALDILYRAREMRFDHLQTPKQQSIDHTLFVLGEGSVAEDFCLYANQNGFQAVLLSTQKLLSINGHIGKFDLHFNDESIRRYAQGALFVDLPELLHYKGIESASDFDSKEALLKHLQHRLGEFTYKDILNFNPEYCQYEDRREKCCCACADICPTFGIYNDDTQNKLHFSSIDCIECGSCLSVCPTGSIQFKEFPQKLFHDIARSYQGWQILLIDEAHLEILQQHKLKLKASTLPLIVPELNALNPLSLLTLIQESGSNLTLFCQKPQPSLLEAIEIINTLTQKAYQTIGIDWVQNVHDLQNSIDQLMNIEQMSYHYTPRDRDHDRTIFAQRLRFVIKDHDLGRLDAYPHFRYGEIRLKEGCTLCLSCVGACNVGALGANEQNFTLTFNPSLCTTCEYCLLSCPEHVMILERNGITLHQSWFETRILAKDEPFKCVECGTPFATTQSIQKIKNILTPQFGNDERKIRSLECCPDCKVRLMAGGAS